MKEILKTAFVALLVILAAVVVANTKGTDKLDWEKFKLDFSVQEDSFSYEIAESEYNGIYQNSIGSKSNTYIMVGKNPTGTYRMYFIKKVGIKSIVLRLDDLVVGTNGEAEFSNNEGSSMIATFVANQVIVNGNNRNGNVSIGDQGIKGNYTKVKGISKFAMNEFNI